MSLRRDNDLRKPEDQAVSLKDLARCVLQKGIQSGHHSATKDTFVTMYKTVKEEWERDVYAGRYLFKYSKKKADCELIIILLRHCSCMWYII